MRLATRTIRLSLAAFALLLAGMASSASAAPSAATASVAASFTGGFVPATLNITVGDSVKWTNADGAPHTTTANGGAWNGSLPSLGSTFTFTFNQAGVFTYKCSFHANMVGTVNVAAPAATSAPPTATPAPTPVPTVRTAPPTPAPTAQPTAVPTAEPTVVATPQPSATTAPTTARATSSPASTTSAAVAVASPAASPNALPTAGAPANESGPGAVVIGGAAVLVVGLGALAWLLLRR